MSTRESWALLRQGPRDPQPEQTRQETLTCMRLHRPFWVIVQYRCNYSAFNGYHWTPSDYSGIRCLECMRYWRTKAAYVDELPMADAGVI